VLPDTVIACSEERPLRSKGEIGMGRREKKKVIMKRNGIFEGFERGDFLLKS